jgi:hypothetical protein
MFITEYQQEANEIEVQDIKQYRQNRPGTRHPGKIGISKQKRPGWDNKQ